MERPGNDARGGEGLGAALRARREEILAEWVRRARALPAARALTEPALRDYIPALVERIAVALERDGVAEPPEVHELASEHALERLSEGYDVAQAAAEFIALRETILDLWQRAPAPLDPAEVRVVNRAIDEALVASVARFTRTHERTLVALDRVSSAALGAGEAEHFLARLLTVLLETTAAADVALILLRGEDDVLRIRATAGGGIERGALELRVGEGFAGQIAARNEPLLVRDASTDPLVASPIRRLGIHAFYGVPLAHDGRVIGVAEMGSRTAYEFSREDQQLFRTMAQRATSMIVQSELVRSQRRMAEALEHGDAFLLVDREWRIVLVNATQERLSRRRRQETVGRRIWDLWPDIASPDSPYWVEYHRCMDERVPVSFEAYYAPLGIWTGVTAYPVPDGIAVSFRDISDRKEAEWKLAETQALVRQRDVELRRIFELTPDMIAVADTEGRLREVNRALTQLLGYSEEEMLDRPFVDFVHPDDRGVVREESRRVRRGGTAERFLVRFRTKAGEYRWISWNVAADVDAQRGIAVGRDVTDEKRRSEFEQQLVAIVSHDLRNPLHAILLGAQSLTARGGLDARTEASLARIRASAERAARMVQDLLDFTRARVGHGIPVTPRPADLAAIARGVADEARAAAPGRTIGVEAESEVRGEWDPDRVAQAATNLVVNALKYGAPDAPVTIRVAASGDGAALEVHNEGRPIPPDLLDHLFEPYRRGSAEPLDRTSVGLGLYITREIVRAHGGEVEVTSSDAEGTRFTIRLPRRARASGPEAVAQGG